MGQEARPGSHPSSAHEARRVDTPRCRFEGYLQGRFARLRPASPAGLRPASPAGLSYPQVAGRVMVERHVHEGLAE